MSDCIVLYCKLTMDVRRRRRREFRWYHRRFLR